MTCPDVARAVSLDLRRRFGDVRPMWQKCSICKKPIGFGAQYLKCAISTCNRKRFQLYFCSAECWDAHNPDQNHRNPGYTEHLAPRAP